MNVERLEKALETVALYIEPSSDGDIIVLAIPRSDAAGAETVSVDVLNDAFVAQIDQHFKYLLSKNDHRLHCITMVSPQKC